jgi:HptB-dependent secretion and biofilm anti anti-sigma factor
MWNRHAKKLNFFKAEGKNMEITRHLQNGTYDVTLIGQFTFNDHPEFREVLDKFKEKDVTNIVLHMGRVEFIDSAALGMLLLALDESEKHRKPLLIHGAAGQVKKMFDMAQFHTMFAMS